MRQVFIINPKGGCGKTTIATSLAGYYAKQAFETCLIDHDEQKSSMDWARSRPKSCGEVIALPDNAVSLVDLQKMIERDMHIVHDMPAACKLADIEDSIKVGDKIVVPILPSPTDIKAALRFIMGLYRSGFLERDIDIGIVGNRIKKNTLYSKVLTEFLERVDIPVVANLRDSQNYIRAMDRGLSLFDLPSSRVLDDTQQWQSLLDWIETSK